MRFLLQWLALAVVAVALLATSERAQAAAEFCPAHLASIAQNSQTVWTFSIDAATPRSVSGEVFAQTDQGWFAWTFPMTPLHPGKSTIHAGAYTVDVDRFVSPVMLVTLPASANVLRAFVRQATTHGETVFGWDTEGGVTCEPDVFATTLPVAQAVAAQTALPPVVAEKVDAPYAESCALPYAQAAMAKQARTTLSADFTAAPGNAVIVDVAIDKSGAVLDAWLLGTSGSVNYDQAALRIAKASTYSPAVSYCKAVASVVAIPIRFR